MEGTNSLLKNIVVAATQYNNHKIERNLVYLQGQIDVSTLNCLSIGTPKAINFPFVSNEKLMFLGVPIFKHIVMML